MITDTRRVKNLHTKTSDKRGESVVYWMSRDQRLENNWALYYAYEKAQELSLPLQIIFIQQEKFLNVENRIMDFMKINLYQMWDRSWMMGIPFHFAFGEPAQAIKSFYGKHIPELIVADYSPLRIKSDWLKDLVEKVDTNIVEVDAHNIFPVEAISPKQEYAARTIRPKIHSQLKDIVELPPVIPPNMTPIPRPLIMYEAPPDPGLIVKSGRDEAIKTLRSFINERLEFYDNYRNDPTKYFLSDLSPYLHFGQIYAGEVYNAVQESSAHQQAKDVFVEELVIRRELAENYCHYNKLYDSFSGFPEWARKTLDEHRNDRREFTYELEELENANTHDPAWNAAQKEMMKTGKMHGYMRMYWGKKILEWSDSPENALRHAIYLNDKYSIDGRDPNGYVGIAWCIGGVHDRPWFERAIFGKIRYMAYSGLERRFKVNEYIERVERL